MALKTDWKAGEKGLTGAVNDAATAINDHETQLATRLSEAELNATFAAVEAARVEAVEAASAATALVSSLGSTVVSATDNGDGTFTIWGPVTPTDPGNPAPSGLYTDTYSNTY